MTEFNSSRKLSHKLSKGMLASNDCLPHAAMNLGSVRGVGTRPSAGLVWHLVIEPQMHNWVLYRLDDGGGFVGDTWHGTLDDALAQAKKEFGVDMSEAAGAASQGSSKVVRDE